jgi:hypothetical protein
METQKVSLKDIRADPLAMNSRLRKEPTLISTA